MVRIISYPSLLNGSSKVKIIQKKKRKFHKLLNKARFLMG